MHLYVVTRGIKPEVDDFINQLQGQYLDFDIKKKGTFGAKKAGIVKQQLSVRPIQLWEFGFPKEQLDLMCTTMFGRKAEGSKLGMPQHKWMNKFVNMIRRMLKLLPIPKYDDKFSLACKPRHMELVGLGIKEDRTLECGTEGL